MGRFAPRHLLTSRILAVYGAITLLVALAIGVLLGAGVEAGPGHVRLGLVVGLAGLDLLLIGPGFAAIRAMRRKLALTSLVSDRDALTQLPGRGLLRSRAKATIGRSPSNRRITIAIVSFDRFKQINAALGDGSGDRLVLYMGERLSGAMRGADTVARLGDDRFGLVFRDLIDPQEALQRLRETIRRDVQFDGLTLAIETSIGFVTVSGGERDVDLHLHHAEIAMRAASAQQSGVLPYSAEIERYDADHLELVTELQDAIDNDQLVLHYQPQIEAATGRAVAIEALWRWAHPTRGLIVPDQFLPLAEETEVIETVTDWVLNTALRDLKRVTETGFEMSVAVNVSPRTIARDDFTPRVLKALIEAAVAPSRLTVEVTETALMGDHARGGEGLGGLASAGVGVSVDDFGRGQTSLGYLSSLPVDELKIDRSFVTDMNDHAGHAAIVRSVIELAHNLGMIAVAEGVETPDVLSSLRIAHCDRVQGFHTARPMLIEELLEWLATRPVPVVPTVPAREPVVSVRKRRNGVRAPRFVRDWTNRDIRVNSGH